MIYGPVALTGIPPALTTPFGDDGPSLGRLRENIAAYERLDLGGYLLLGSTGEAVLLDDDERWRILETARESIPAGRSLIAGVSAESTRAAVRQAGEAAERGADVVLVSAPHYYKGQMTAEALSRHFTAVAEACPVPVLLYNVPKFTGLELPLDTVVRAGEHPNVAGMKESSGDLDYLKRVIAAAGSQFTVLCGASSILRPALDAGAVGGILAAATFLPEPLIRIAAGEAVPHEQVAAVEKTAAFVVGRCGIPGIKAAMDLRGLHGGSVRAPLRSVARATRQEIESSVDGLVRSGALAGLRI